MEFSINNAVHASTGFAPFYVNLLRVPRITLTLIGRGPSQEEEIEFDSRLAKVTPIVVRRQQSDLLSQRRAVMCRVRDVMADTQDKLKEQADKSGRRNTHVFRVGDLVLLDARNLPTGRVSAVGSSKLRPRFIGPFRIVHVRGKACTLRLPLSLQTHPTFYVGMLKPYHQTGDTDPEEDHAEALSSLIAARSFDLDDQSADSDRVMMGADCTESTSTQTSEAVRRSGRQRRSTSRRDA